MVEDSCRRPRITTTNMGRATITIIGSIIMGQLGSKSPSRWYPIIGRPSSIITIIGPTITNQPIEAKCQHHRDHLLRACLGGSTITTIGPTTTSYLALGSCSNNLLGSKMGCTITTIGPTIGGPGGCNLCLSRVLPRRPA